MESSAPWWKNRVSSPPEAAGYRMNTPSSNSRPWYREAMVWLVIVIPMTALAAGIWTIWAATHGADAPIERVEPVARAS